MRRTAASAVISFVLVAIGCASSAAKTTATAPTSGCPKGSLHTVYKGTHKCLRLVIRQRIFRGLVQARDRGVSGPRAYAVVAGQFRVSVVAVKATARESALRSWAAFASPRLPDGVPLLADGPSAASELSAEPDCVDGEPGRGVVRLTWRPAAEEGAEQRVIATIFRDGFERQAFEASGTLAPGRGTFEWYRVHGQAIHFWKVLTRYAEGWVPSAVGRFEGPTCPVDSALPTP
jgi:hypothetical protein